MLSVATALTALALAVLCTALIWGAAHLACTTPTHQKEHQS